MTEPGFGFGHAITDRYDSSEADNAFVSDINDAYFQDWMASPGLDEDDETNGPRDIDGFHAVVTNKTNNNEDPNVLTVPLRDSFPVQLHVYLDLLDAEYGGAPPSPSTAPSYLSPERLPPFTWNFVRSQHCPVTKDDLAVLQQCIEDTEVVLHNIRQGILDTKVASNRREDRFRMSESNEDITEFMKSRGLGSPLVKSIGIDDFWPFDWGYGFPRTHSRRKIYNGSSSRPSTPPAVGI